jgi:hypothetical protein
MLFDTIKVCECAKCPHRTSSSSSMPLVLRNAARVASCYVKRKIQIESGPKAPDRGNRRSHSTNPALSMRIPSTWLANVVSSRSFDDFLLWPTAAR